MVHSDALIGRDRERELLERSIASLDGGPLLVDLEGEAGIGKTTLFDSAVELGRRLAMHVLVARPTQSESRLSFVGLTDLLAEDRDQFDDLPDPQRRALEVALLLRDDDDVAPDPRAIGSAVLGVVRRLAAEGAGLLIAIDDLQWLDPASVAAISFALRRIDTERVAVLTATRPSTARDSLTTGHAFRRERLALSPLRVGAIQALLLSRLGVTLPRTRLLRLHEASNGNPLVALEVTRTLEAMGWPEPGRPLDVPADPDSLFEARLVALGPLTKEVLATIAASANPTHELLQATASDPDVVDRAIREAVEAGVLRHEHHGITFTHPLLASAAYARLDPAERRAVHVRIAGAVHDLEERARHLALASDGPDPEVAATLDAASERAEARGAWVSAAELAELAAGLTPQDDVALVRSRRRLAAERLYLAGDSAGSRALLERLVAELEPGPERASALLQLAETHSGDLNAMLPIRRQAVAEAITDARVAALAHRELSRTLLGVGHARDAFAQGEAAIAAAERSGDVRIRVICLAWMTFLELTTGRLTPGVLGEALALESQAGYLRSYQSPSLMDGLRLLHLEDDVDGARRRIVEADRVAREHGDEEARPIILAHLVEVECRAGRFDEAARLAAEVLEIRGQFGLGTAWPQYSIALVATMRGQPEATALATRALELCEASGNENYGIRSRWLLGLASLAQGRWTDAATWLTALPDRLEARGYGAMRQLQVMPDAIEALIGAGDIEAASRLFNRLEAVAREAPTRWVLVRVARCNGMLTGAAGEHAAAVDRLMEALAQHDRLPDPVERGRTLLALGRAQRRHGDRRDARASLQRALTTFDGIESIAWAAQVRGELARIGGRIAADRALTPSETAVARLVAAGRSNREVAAELFVTERTVETHLSSIYRKLELRSRTELAQRLGQMSEPPT